MNGYQIVSEAINDTLYHGSSIQNLKVINPAIINKKALVFSTPSITFAAIHCIEGGWRIAKFDERLHVKIEKKYLPLLKKACSIYVVNTDNQILDKTFNLNGTIQYYSTKPVKVLKEIKYKSVEDCWERNSVKWTVIR